MEGETVDFRPTMFVKVHMEGYLIGRKIDVKAHESYQSLFRALRHMFRSFLSNDHNSCNQEEGQEDEGGADDDFILLYENHEGDRMMVTDVPWKLFINTVKRLFIVSNPKAPSSVDGGEAE